MDNADDLRSPIPEDDFHRVVLRRLDMVEDKANSLREWQIKKDVVIDTFMQRLSEQSIRMSTFEEHMQSALEKQTDQIMAKFSSLNTNIESVINKQTFWDNSILVFKWIGAVIAGSALVVWTVGTYIITFMSEHWKMPPASK